MKINEVRKLSPDELKKKLNLFKKDLFNLRFRKVNSQIEDTSKFLKIRKDVAKILTVLNTKK
jgi:large subunit ribosomal protein L29